jgi:hypothetical protein
MASKVRADRTRASQQALASMPQQAKQQALAKARGTGRTFPTSGQRTRSKARSK